MDITSALKDTLFTVAPLLSNALLPGSGGLAASLLAKALGTSSNHEELLSAVQNMTPEQAVAVKKIEADHAIELARIGADLDKARIVDVQDARKRDIEYVRAGRSNARASWMVAGDVIGLCVCLAAACVLSLRDEPIQGEIIILLTTFASYFGLSLRDAHTFEFGSSRGSKEKDQLFGGKN